MTTFTNGPALKAMLLLKRHPIYLRVIRDAKGKFDALDQLNDTPAEGERIIVYRLVSKEGGAFVDWTEKGRRVGGYFPCATYELCEVQPDHATASDTTAWRKWCYEQQARDKERG